MAPFQPSPTPHYSSRSRGQSGKRSGNHQPPERSASFHGRTTTSAVVDPSADLLQRQMRRPKTQPDLLAAAAVAGTGSRTPTVSAPEQIRRRVPAKVLVNVNVQRSLGALQVMASTEWTVQQLVAAAVKQYIKEGRRPLLTSTDPSTFALHYSQFSFERLDHKEKLIGLGSRNFFLCPKSTTTVSATTSSGAVNEATSSASATPSASASSSSSCSKEADKASKIAIPWLRFMEFRF